MAFNSKFPACARGDGGASKIPGLRPGRRRGKQNSKWPFLLFPLLLLAACAPRPTAVPPPPPTALPAVPAGKLVERVEKSGRDIQTLRGLAHARITTADKTVNVTQVLLAAAPDRLRTETLSPFGSPLMILATDGTDLSVFLPGEGRFLSGPASADNLRRFTRLPLRAADLVGLLLYRPPLFPWQQARAETVDATGYRLVLDGPGQRRQDFTFDAARRPTGAAYYDGDRLLLRVRYADLTETPVVFPARAELDMPEYHIQASLEFDADLALNDKLDDARFRLQPPKGVEVEGL